jgi:hypothetical protein
MEMPYHDADYWVAVHDLIIYGDMRARDEIYSLLPLLIRLLSRKHPHDRDEAAESAEDAVLDYLSEPERFDPCRGCALVTWLAIQARGHMSHLLRKKASREKHEKAVGIAEKIFEEKMSEMGVGMAISKGRDEDKTEEWRQELDDLLRMLNPCDCDGVLLLRRDAPIEEWVQHLHIEDLPVEEQRHRINREKDRLKKKLRRLAQRMQGGGGKQSWLAAKRADLNRRQKRWWLNEGIERCLAPLLLLLRQERLSLASKVA